MNGGYCRACWYAAADTDVMLSGKTDTATFKTKNTVCCNYGSKGTKTTGYDCLTLPGAVKDTDMAAPIPNNRFCGRSKGLGDMDGGEPATICSEFKIIYTPKIILVEVGKLSFC